MVLVMLNRHGIGLRHLAAIAQWLEHRTRIHSRHAGVDGSTPSSGRIRFVLSVKVILR